MMRFLTLFLALSILSLNAVAQKSELYIDSSSGSCIKSIRLNEDGTYTFKNSCENIFNISFGTWVQIKDTVRCTQIDTKDFKIVKILPENIEGAKMISVKIFDQAGQNVTEKIKVKQYIQRKGYYEMALDSTKTKRIDSIRDSSTIIVEPFDRLLNGTIGVRVDSFTNFEITLNVPNDMLYNITSDWIDTGNVDFLRTKDALFSVKTYPADGNRKPFRIRYKKYRD